MRERVVVAGSSRHLIGIVTEPPDPRSGVILLNAGLLHRVGPARLYVTLARRLADLGFAALRLDLGGLGDSFERPGTEALEERARLDVSDAIDWMRASMGLGELVLFGMCLGGDVACLAARSDPRVRGVVVINGGVGLAKGPTAAKSEASSRTALRLYASRALELSSWKRLVSGQTDLRRLMRTGLALPGLSARMDDRRAYKTRLALALARVTDHGARMLLVQSSGSVVWDILDKRTTQQVQESNNRGSIDVLHVEGTDHSFTPVDAQVWLVERVVRWIQEGLAGGGDH